MDWPELVEGVFRDARDSVGYRLIVACLGALLSVLVVAGLGWLRRRWTGFSRKRQRAARALRDQGEYHAELKHRHEAMDLYDLAVQLNPKEGHSYYLRGCLHAELGDPNRAIADWRRCLARLPRHRDAERRLAECGEQGQSIMPRWAYPVGLGAVVLLIVAATLLAQVRSG